LARHQCNAKPRAAIKGESLAMRCYNRNAYREVIAREVIAQVDGPFLGRPPQRRGVAQPGRAPGSGPGGRRFKSSLPDHIFSRSFGCLGRAGGLSFFGYFGTFGTENSCAVDLLMIPRYSLLPRLRLENLAVFQ
jgi:hypothetical protein